MLQEQILQKEQELLDLKDSQMTQLTQERERLRLVFQKEFKDNLKAQRAQYDREKEEFEEHILQLRESVKEDVIQLQHKFQMEMFFAKWKLFSKLLGYQKKNQLLRVQAVQNQFEEEEKKGTFQKELMKRVLMN